MSHPSARRFVSLVTRETLALILAGGKGSRLTPLTEHRVKPAVPFSGKYRLIDFPLSNCINSGIRRIGVLTQYKAHSLIRHLQQGWGYIKGEFGEFIEILPAQQRVGPFWYRGTADAVYQNLDIVKYHRPKFVLILGGDHVYKMDYGDLLAWHIQHDAAVTVCCVEVPVPQAHEFGILKVDAQHNVLDFIEKPAAPPGIPGHPDRALVSMGIYVFGTEFLVSILTHDAAQSKSRHDFGADIIPKAINQGRVVAYPFLDKKTGTLSYWRDVGSLDSYWQANLELIGRSPSLELEDANWPIWTYHPPLPPTRFEDWDAAHPGCARNSLVAGGCEICGATITRSVLSPRVKVAPLSHIEECVILHNVSVGKQCRLRKVIVDGYCSLPDGLEVGFDPDADAVRYHVSPNGICVITPEMLPGELP